MAAKSNKSSLQAQKRMDSVVESVISLEPPKIRGITMAEIAEKMRRNLKPPWYHQPAQIQCEREAWSNMGQRAVINAVVKQKQEKPKMDLDIAAASTDWGVRATKAPRGIAPLITQPYRSLVKPSVTQAEINAHMKAAGLPVIIFDLSNTLHCAEQMSSPAAIDVDNA